mmetsp:Transcript_55198/g.118660  ORF Transcript_55198/g.118660 Transcript_55198/m.118660 type:complete len:146 (-) Transcript_55198:300-737(-)|eukprot:CAMPEP_0180438494 /NCGR_PEP_ID=MMETSP1036_2-20121128/12098_1 /TAXON_ID=632150 /ORGANISM="Azadinium spinosum, Strain 3D9" /LENGTH=145 /DNA_ID=CAMNT_0022444597 /DNA_START=65 /DNA_END=502 /DNA_ORIENTATION=-
MADCIVQDFLGAVGREARLCRRRSSSILGGVIFAFYAIQQLMHLLFHSFYGLSDDIIEYARTHEEIVGACLAHQKDVDQIYTRWKEKLGGLVACPGYCGAVYGGRTGRRVVVVRMQPAGLHSRPHLRRAANSGAGALSHEGYDYF